MSDAPKPSNENGEAPFASALIERLTKRATAPIGVIDVRYAEDKYFRIASWLARRSALVDLLKKHYGVEVAATNGEHTLASQLNIQRRSGEQVNVFSPTIQSFFSSEASSGSSPGLSSTKAGTESSDAPQQQTWGDVRPSGLADILAERSSSSAVQPPLSSESTFRVSRRPPPMLPDADASQISSRARTGPSTEQPRGDANESVRPITGQIPDFVFRNPVEEASIEGKADAGKSNRAPASPAFRDERAGAATSNPPQEAGTRTQEKRAGAALKNAPGDTASSSEQSQVRELANTSTLQSLPLVISQTKGDEHLYGRPSVAAPLSSKERVGKRGGHGGPPVQAHQNRDGSQKSDVGSTAAVAFAAPVESFNPEKPEMVWRTQQADPRAAGSTTQESRFVSTSSGGVRSGEIESGPNESASVGFAAATLEGGQLGSPSSAQAQSNEVQAEHISPQAIRSISERVIRAITLDLKLERERRGVTKWR